MRTWMSNEERESLIEEYHNSNNKNKRYIKDELAKKYNIDERTVYRIIRRNKECGSPKIHHNSRTMIQKYIKENPDTTLERVKEDLELESSIRYIRRVVIELGYTVNRKTIYVVGKKMENEDE